MPGKQLIVALRTSSQESLINIRSKQPSTPRMPCPPTPIQNPNLLHVVQTAKIESPSSIESKQAEHETKQTFSRNKTPICCIPQNPVAFSGGPGRCSQQTKASLASNTPPSNYEKKNAKWQVRWGLLHVEGFRLVGKDALCCGLAQASETGDAWIFEFAVEKV